MKRISSAMVVAATALTLAVTPAYAEDAENTGNGAIDTNTTAPVDQPEDNKGETDKPGEGEDNKSEDNKDETNNPPAPQKQTSGSSQGHIIGAVSGTLAAVLTTGLIVFSDPRGINKIIDALNREFHLGIPHVHVPQVQLPKLPF